MVGSRLRLVAFTALLVGSISFSPSSQPLRAAAASGIAFQVPSVVDPIHTNGEPDIGLDAQKRVFVSGPTGTGTQRSTWFGSVDGGQTFRVMTQKVPPSAAFGIPAPGPGGGDTDINFDRSGKQYFADLYALACLRVAVTGPTNSGATDLENVYPGGCSGIPGADRQWLAVYDPSPGTPNQSVYKAAGGQTPLIYLEFNNLVGPGPNGGGQWNKSTDGLIYLNATGDEIPGVSGGTVPLGAVYSPFGADGYPAIDQVTGKVFQAAGCDNKTCGTSTATTATPGLYLNIGTPDATGTLHFLDATGTGQDLTKLIKIADTPTGSPDTLFSVLSMDSARNLIVVWCISSGTPAQRQVFVSAASAVSGWKSWSTPIRVSDGFTATGDAVNVFPWIKAGGPGRADAVWYGSDQNVDPSSQSGQSWNVFMNQVVFPTDSTGAVTGGAPNTTLVKVTPHPMHYNDICLLGSACVTSTPPGNRNLADFFEVNIDQSGAAEVVYDDTSNGLIQTIAGFTSPPGLVDHAGAGVITIARQSSGTGLFGTAVSGSSNAPVSGLDDPPGDALFPVIGGSDVRGMDIVGTSLQLSADGTTLNVTTKVVDLSNPAATALALAIAGTNYLQYATRWQLGNTIFYAAMENTAANTASFYAGKAQSIDLCSVSACFPHVITYPEPGFGGRAEPGSVNCPATPSASNPCSLTIAVNVGDIGMTTATAASSLLEEVGSYTFASTIQDGMESNGSAQSDTVPLEIDGACCYNFKASVQNGPPPPCHEADGNGDIHSAGSGKASFSMDKDHCEDLDNDDVHAQDSSAGMNFQSTQILSATFNDALKGVVIAGNGTDNGNPVTFTATAVSGSAGVGTFSLTLSDGYTNSGTLLDGSIQLQ
jgi:hypothetical protein